MTYHITRHARISVPKALKPMFTVKSETVQEESKGLKRLAQKSVSFLPVPAFGILAGINIFEPSLAVIGLIAGSPGHVALTIGSAITIMASAVPILKDAYTGRRKYLPGKTHPGYTHSSIKDIEPYAEWDNVFLPYAVESFNGVKVKSSDGEYRKPIHLHTTPYIEFRTKSREDYIDYSVLEAQKLS